MTMITVNFIPRDEELEQMKRIEKLAADVNVRHLTPYQIFRAGLDASESALMLQKENL